MADEHLRRADTTYDYRQSLRMHPPGPKLWTLYFPMLWIHMSLVAGLLHVARHGWPPGWGWLAWIAGLALLCRSAANNRIGIHDLIVGMSLKERVGAGVLLALTVLTPIFFHGPKVIPDGLFWFAVVLMVLAVMPPLIYLMLGLSLLAAWFAAGALEGVPAIVLLWLVAVSWLAMLATTHVVYTGEDYGLRGWWPLKRIVVNTLVAAIPATVGGVLMYWIWPQMPRRAFEFTWDPETARVRRRPIDTLDELELMAVIWQAVLGLALFALLLLMMLYIRRWLLRRGRLTRAAELLPGQTARLEYLTPAAAPEPKQLEGLRGQIVSLWGRWALSLEREGLARHPGETAEAYIERLSYEAPHAVPDAAMTDLLDRAHYSGRPIEHSDVERMRVLVQDELSRQSLRLQQPPESI